MSDLSANRPRFVKCERKVGFGGASEQSVQAEKRFTPTGRTVTVQTLTNDFTVCAQDRILKTDQIRVEPGLNTHIGHSFPYRTVRHRARQPRKDAVNLPKWMSRKSLTGRGLGRFLACRAAQKGKKLAHIRTCPTHSEKHRYGKLCLMSSNHPDGRRFEDSIEAIEKTINGCALGHSGEEAARAVAYAT